MEIGINKDGTKLTILPSGRIDSTTAGEVEEKINEALTDEINELVIDMANVSFVSSKGIRILLTLHREMEIKGKLVLTNINNSVREVLKLSALLSVFNVL